MEKNHHVRRLVLASASPQRRKLLEDAGYAFDSVSPREHVECGICSAGGPAALVIELAASKAVDVAAQMKERSPAANGDLVILACDTVAECGGEVLGKPRDESHARAMLALLSGSVHRVYSGVCVWQPHGDGTPGEPDVRLATTELRMDPLEEDAIEDYLASGMWQGKAGAFGYQDRPGWLHVTSGSESNVIGLPMELVGEMLAAHDVHPRAL